MKLLFKICCNREVEEIWHDKAKHPCYKRVLEADETDKFKLAK